MTIAGRDKLTASFNRRKGPGFERAIGRALFVAADLLKSEAQVSITRGAVSGRSHVPSSPWQPPNNDTSVLRNNIESALIGPLEAQVSSNAPYSTALEFGTSKMAARPFLRPARDKVKDKARRLISAELNKQKGT